MFYLATKQKMTKHAKKQKNLTLMKRKKNQPININLKITDDLTSREDIYNFHKQILYVQ